MKFELEKKGKAIYLFMHFKNKPILRRNVCLKKDIKIRGKPLNNKEELLEKIELHKKSGTIFSSDEFLNKNIMDNTKLITEETENIVKSYMKIQRAMKSIELSEDVQNSDFI